MHCIIITNSTIIRAMLQVYNVAKKIISVDVRIHNMMNVLFNELSA